MSLISLFLIYNKSDIIFQAPFFTVGLCLLLVSKSRYPVLAV